MFIDISDILKAKGQKKFAFNENPEDEEQKLKFRDKVEISGTVICDSSHVEVSGTVKGVILENCSRCLEKMEYPIEYGFEGVFSEEENPDEDIYGYTGSRIEIDRLVLDTISLELPMQFLCKEDCKGLCPVCGINRNKESCNCETLIRDDNPFSKLKDLFNT